MCVSAGPTITGLNVLYNQIDHVAYCLRGTGNMSNWTFSHNVCGPGIGYGGSVDAHYTQTEGVDGLTMDNNAFEGPFDAGALAASAHNNVSHACGSNMEFSNNIVWHADSRAQTILWGDDCSVQSARANNNLFVEDPGCGSVCPTMSLWVEGANGVTFNNNTIQTNTGPPAGGIFVRSNVHRSDGAEQRRRRDHERRRRLRLRQLHLFGQRRPRTERATSSGPRAGRARAGLRTTARPGFRHPRPTTSRPASPRRPATKGRSGRRAGVEP